MKKILILALIVAILAAMMCPIFATEIAFKDTTNHWAEEYILKAAERKLVQGYNGFYRPNDRMTRAELVTILWRAMGEPEPAKEATFTDLTQDWYKDAVAWAEETSVVNGIGNGKFGPDGNVTREQLATILHRMSGGKAGMEVMFASIYDQYYRDEESISSYAKSAVYWCVFNEVYCGEATETVGDALVPKADATRGQIAVMINRYLDREN